MGEKVLAVQEGDILWWPPGHDHVLLEASADFDLFVVGVTPELSGKVLSPRTSPGVSSHVRSRLPATEATRWMALCAAPINKLDPLAIDTRVGDLWLEAHSYRPSQPLPHHFTVRALTSLLGRPELARDDVAELVRVCPSELSRHFRRDLGLTLTTYRTRVKILHFIREVDAGATNLLSASLAAGFGSYSQCHRAFRHALGCSPRDFFDTNMRATMRDSFAPMHDPFAASPCKQGIG
jgi:AraC-like DNA-binding protein